MTETGELEKAMTVDELAKEIRKLPIHQQLALLEILSQTIRVGLQQRTIQQMQGILATAEPAPSDAELQQAYADYLDEKYR